jgi:hypothetical protein
MMPDGQQHSKQEALKRERNIKPYCCPHGHVMGYVTRNSSRMTVLYLFARSINGEVDDLEQVDLLCIIENPMDVKTICTVPGCWETRHWRMGEEQMGRLLRRKHADV